MARLRKIRRLCAIVGTAMLFVSPIWAAVEIESVDIGFGGLHKVGHWIPVNVTVRSDEGCSGNLVVAAPDSVGLLCEYDGPAISIPKGTSKHTRLVRVGRTTYSLRVEVRSPNDGNDSIVASKLLAEKTLAISLEQSVLATQQMILTLGDATTLVKSIRQRNGPETESFRIASVTAPDDLPVDWFAFEGIDLMILPTGDPAFCHSLNDAHWQAIEHWVSMGGRLILSVGQNAEELLEEGEPLTRFLPGKFAARIMQRETSELEAYAKSNQRLDLLWRELPRDQRGIPVARLTSPRGLEAAAQGTGRRRVAWVTRTAHGFGSVNFVACDLDAGPIAEWKGRPRLLTRLIDDSLGVEPKQERDARSQQVTHLGFNDLSGQLRASLDQFEGVKLVPFSLIAGLAAAYILLIGPIDYLILKRFASRMEWTWLTFPLAIIGLAAVAVVLAKNWKGQANQQNVAELLDVDPERGITRCTAWSHVYCPTAGRYSLQFDSTGRLAKANGRLLSWQGLPGTSFGGMHSSSSTALVADPYEIRWNRGAGQGTSDNPNGQTQVSTTVEDVPIPTWSSRSLVGTWWSRQPAGDSESMKLRVSRSGNLEGSFKNPLPVPMKDAVICYGRMFYKVGTLAPGATFDVGQMSRPQNFRYHLTRRKIVDDKEIINPWEKESFDIQRILELTMFHNKAGGSAYTGLLNRYHQELDMSDHLETGTAVLYGRLSNGVSSWTLNAEPIEEESLQRWTYCRVLFPVADPASPTERTASAKN